MAEQSEPVCIVCVGMAGSGKTTFMQRINSYLHENRKPPYVVNLDPAVLHVPYDSNIDIRDSVNYKEVMKQYNLGPNGGILTSLNLFATKIDQILGLLEKRTAPDPDRPTATPIQNIIVDTPGQIEVFVWSASGAILLDSLATSFPTVIAYIIDTPRTASTSTFMSNMLYACSILYKTKLPMILVFNKTDVKDASFAKDWMTDFEAFQNALREEEEAGVFGGENGTGGVGGGSGYMSSLLNSMSLVLDEFYRHLNMVSVSSMTGDGIDEFFAAVKDKAAEFVRDYRPELERRQKQRADKKNAPKDKALDKLMKDMSVHGDAPPPIGVPSRRAGTGTLSDLEDDDEDEEDEETEDQGRGGEGLEDRYKAALNSVDSNKASSEAADASFQRYLQTSLRQ